MMVRPLFGPFIENLVKISAALFSHTEFFEPTYVFCGRNLCQLATLIGFEATARFSLRASMLELL
jgi:hypothetical protein